MEERYTDLLLYIRSAAGASSFQVTADLEDGSGFSGGEFHFEAGSLLLAEADPQAYGLLLFNALFQGPIRDAYHKALGIAEQQSAGRLRVRLWIDEGAVELHALPWERLYHLYHGQLLPLATSTLTPFSRYTRLPIAEPAPLAARPVRLLAAFANPRALPGGLPPIQVEQEILTLREALGDLRAGGQVEVTLLPGVTGVSPELRAQLEAEGYRIVAGESSLTTIARLLPDHHILHFWGHGAFRRGESGGSALLFLEKADGSWEGVTDDAIVQQLAPLSPLPQLIFLAACESAKRDAGASNPFVGLAPKLVRAGVPVVVAMQALVPMTVARQLTGDFYRNLFEHGVADRAMNEARALLFKASSSDWAIPVLFSRLRGNRLFAVPEGEASAFERAWFEPETVWVPAGRFLMGSDAGEGVPAEETPQHTVTLPAFRIGKFPVTNREYAEFLKRVPKQEVPRKAGWFLREPPADKLDHPVVGVSWHDAWPTAIGSARRRAAATACPRRRSGSVRRAAATGGASPGAMSGTRRPVRWGRSVPHRSARTPPARARAGASTWRATCRSGCRARGEAVSRRAIFPTPMTRATGARRRKAGSPTACIAAAPSNRVRRRSAAPPATAPARRARRWAGAFARCWSVNRRGRQGCQSFAWMLSGRCSRSRKGGKQPSSTVSARGRCYRS